MEVGAEFFVEAAGLGEAVEFLELEAEVEIHVAPISTLMESLMLLAHT